MLALVNGKFYNEKQNFEAMLIVDGKIKQTGSTEEIISKIADDDKVVDLKGKLALPGFIDSHAHGGSFTAMAMEKIDLSEYNTIEEYISAITTFINENPDKGCYSGTGWQSPLFGDHGPTKELLDEICSSKPILIRAAEGHTFWANSKAIELAGITGDVKDPKGGIVERNKDGSIRGTFKDEAQGLIEDVIPDDSVELYKKAIMEYQNLMIPYGYTGVTEMMMKKNSNLHKAFIELAENGELLIKTQLTYLATPEDSEAYIEELKDRRPIISNKLIDGYYAKIFIDGVVESATAWLEEEYSNQPGYYGEPIWEDEKLFETCIDLDRMGYDLHFHVIGDRAVAQMIDAVEKVIEANGEKDRRPVAAHVQLMNKNDISRMKKAGISVSANPYWFFKDEVYSVLNEFPMLGSRADEQFPMKSLIDAGICVSAGSDYSVTADPNPLLAMWVGMERSMEEVPQEHPASILNPKEKVSFDEMLRCVTVNGAYTMNIEEYTGTLDVGKFADIAVLDKDIFDSSIKRCTDAKVIMTISEGDIVYQAE